MKDIFNGMFGKVAPGMCRLSMSGAIAVKTDNGYKSYNTKTKRLTNCSNFVMDIGEDFFFVIPTNHVSEGDIILVNGKPRCVISADKNSINVINYENSTIENVVPERHIFMGETYFYGKIVSMFGTNIGKGKNVLKYMMFSELMNNKGGSGNNLLLPLMLMNGGTMDNIFDGMFDLDFDIDDEDEETEGKEE